MVICFSFLSLIGTCCFVAANECGGLLYVCYCLYSAIASIASVVLLLLQLLNTLLLMQMYVEGHAIVFPAANKEEVNYIYCQWQVIFFPTYFCCWCKLCGGNPVLSFYHTRFFKCQVSCITGSCFVTSFSYFVVLDWSLINLVYIFWGLEWRMIVA